MFDSKHAHNPLKTMTPTGQWADSRDLSYHIFHSLYTVFEGGADYSKATVNGMCAEKRMVKHMITS